MSLDLVVRYRNEINRASHTLDVVEARIVLTAIAQVPAGEVTERDVYWVYADDLTELGSNPKTVYRHMKAAADNLFNRYITLSEDDAKGKIVRKFRWVQAVQYQEDAGRIALRFSTDILPFITHIQTEFTHYNLKEIKGFRSYYSIRLYSKLSQYKDTGRCILSVTELRDELEVGDSYTAYADLKRFVIAPAMKQINNAPNTIFKVSLQEKKIGRKVDQLIFTFKMKNPVLDVIDVDTGDLFAEGLSHSKAELSPEQINMFGDILSGQNKKFLKIAEDFYYDCRRKELLNWEGYDEKQCTANLKKKLKDSDFVIAIYPWLKKVGFVFH